MNAYASCTYIYIYIYIYVYIYIYIYVYIYIYIGRDLGGYSGNCWSGGRFSIWLSGESADHRRYRRTFSRPCARWQFSDGRGFPFPPGPPPEGQTVGLGKKGFDMRLTMLNVSSGDGPVGFALKMLEHFCRIYVKLLMEALAMDDMASGEAAC